MNHNNNNNNKIKSRSNISSARYFEFLIMRPPLTHAHYYHSIKLSIFTGRSTNLFWSMTFEFLNVETQITRARHWQKPNVQQSIRTNAVKGEIKTLGSHPFLNRNTQSSCAPPVCRKVFRMPRCPSNNNELTLCGYVADGSDSRGVVLPGEKEKEKKNIDYPDPAHA